MLPILFGLVILYSIAMSRLFKWLGLAKKNYIGHLISYSGGTVMILGTVSGLIIYHLFGRISYIKLYIFIFIFCAVYIIGLIDDIFGNIQIKGIKQNIQALFLKRFSTGIIKAVLILILSCYMYYFFNEEYWLLKGVVTALMSNVFNLLDLRPGRCIKVYMLLSLVLSLAYLRWTKEIFYIVFITTAAFYFFDAYGYSMLGDSGSNFIGFAAGMMFSEAISTRLGMLIASFAVLSAVQLLLDKYSFTKLVNKSIVLNYIDRFLTERQGKENVES
jgi:hypothetical protein